MHSVLGGLVKLPIGPNEFAGAYHTGVKAYNEYATNSIERDYLPQEKELALASGRTKLRSDDLQIVVSQSNLVRDLLTTSSQLGRDVANTFHDSKVKSVERGYLPKYLAIDLAAKETHLKTMQINQLRSAFRVQADIYRAFWPVCRACRRPVHRQYATFYHPTLGHCVREVPPGPRLCTICESVMRQNPQQWSAYMNSMEAHRRNGGNRNNNNGQKGWNNNNNGGGGGGGGGGQQGGNNRNNRGGGQNGGNNRNNGGAQNGGNNSKGGKANGGSKQCRCGKTHHKNQQGGNGTKGNPPAKQSQASQHSSKPPTPKDTTMVTLPEQTKAPTLSDTAKATPLEQTKAPMLSDTAKATPAEQTKAPTLSDTAMATPLEQTKTPKVMKADKEQGQEQGQEQNDASEKLIAIQLTPKQYRVLQKLLKEQEEEKKAELSKPVETATSEAVSTSKEEKPGNAVKVKDGPFKAFGLDGKVRWYKNEAEYEVDHGPKEWL